MLYQLTDLVLMLQFILLHRYVRGHTSRSEIRIRMSFSANRLLLKVNALMTTIFREGN